MRTGSASSRFSLYFGELYETVDAKSAFCSFLSVPYYGKKHNHVFYFIIADVHVLSHMERVSKGLAAVACSILYIYIKKTQLSLILSLRMYVCCQMTLNMLAKG